MARKNLLDNKCEASAKDEHGENICFFTGYSCKIKDFTKCREYVTQILPRIENKERRYEHLYILPKQ